MNSVINFFEPFFNLFLFNHKNLAVNEISFFCAVFLFGTIGKLVDQKPNISGVLVGYGYSIIVFLNAVYLTFVELNWWKATVNILVSVILFVIISEFLLSLIIILFGGFFHFGDVEPRIKRRTALLLFIIFLINIIVSLHIKNLIF
jgi:hypothetical protein